MHEPEIRDRVLDVRDLWSGYGAHPVVRSVSFKTRAGITGLIGSNGAGKSTALKTITGMLKASGGQAQFSGHDVLGRAPHSIVGLGVILVPESGGLFPSMTVEDNLMMGAYMPRARAALSQSMARTFELFPQLAERRSVIARRLSGGEQQMLAIGRAIIAAPRLLILDEPSLGLSPIVIEIVGKAIETIAKSGVSILLCEQNAGLALRISNYVYVMEHGEMIAEGEPAELLATQGIVRAYLGG